MKLLPPPNEECDPVGRPLNAGGAAIRPVPVRTCGLVGEPPGKTTLPKLREIFGLVAAVPPGKTTLPKLRVICCAKAKFARSIATNTPPARFMGTTPCSDCTADYLTQRRPATVTSSS